MAAQFYNKGCSKLIRVCLLFVLLLTPRAFSQVASPITQAPVPGSGQMEVPPPVRINGYPTEVGAEAQSNYFSGEMTFSAGYIDNYYPGSGTNAVSEWSYSIFPTIGWDKTSPRRHTRVQYTPGFTFFEPSSQLNEIDQDATVSYSYRLTPHSTISISDHFAYSSTLFGSGVAGIGEPVSGSIDTVTPAILAPFAQRLTNSANGQYVLQTGRASMIGFSGNATNLHYPDVSETAGLYDSNSRGGSGFYSARILGRQYLGGIYDFSQILFYPSIGEGQTDIHTVAGFYTFYPTERVSLSLVSGAQHYRLSQPSSPDFASWEPTVAVSAGWQALHTNFAASYSHSVTAGGGLLGAFHSDSANAAGRWQLSRTLSAGLSAAYITQKNVESLPGQDSEDGHAISGRANLSYSVGPRVALELGYDRIHQSYIGIPVTTINPDSNRVTVAISWRFTRPLGR